MFHCRWGICRPAEFTHVVNGVHCQNELDETQIQQAGEDVMLPTELAKMIAEDNQEEKHKQSVLGQLSNIQNVDMDQLKDKAQATLEDLKKQTENCSLM